MVRETCGRVIGGDVFLGLPVMQCVGARLFLGLGAHVGALCLHYLVQQQWGSLSGRGYSAAAVGMNNHLQG